MHMLIMRALVCFGSCLVGAGCQLIAGLESVTLDPAADSDSATPALVVEYPLPSGSTAAESITVRGSADAEIVSSVRVAGMTVCSAPDCGIWQTAVSLEIGSNVILVESADRSGQIDQEITLQITRPLLDHDTYNGGGPAFDTPVSIAMDLDNNRALVVDAGLLSLMAVDLDTGDRTVISGGVVGAGDPLQEPFGLALDTDENRSFVTDMTADGVIEIANDSGIRTLLSPVLTSPLGIAFDRLENRLLVGDDDQNAVYEIDLDTGEDAVLSGDSDGTAFNYPRGIVIDSASEIALVSDYYGKRLFSVDLATGDRIILHSTLVWPTAVAVDKSDMKALVIQSDTRPRLTEVDLMSGELRTVSNVGYGSIGVGPEFQLLSGLDVHDGRRWALTIDQELPGVFLVDLNTGDRVVVSR